jgi:hypothetical protein
MAGGVGAAAVEKERRRFCKMGSSLSRMELRHEIAELTALIVGEAANGGPDADAFLQKARAIRETCHPADVRTVEAYTRCDAEEFAAKAYWLFSFVFTLHALMRARETSLHGAIMREMSLDAGTGQFGVMVHTARVGAAEARYSSNATMRFVRDSVCESDYVRLARGESAAAYDTRIYTCDLRASPEVAELLEALMGTPEHYLSLMVDQLARLVDGDGCLRALDTDELEDVHEAVTRCALDMCDDSMRLLASVKRAVVAGRGTRFVARPYVQAVLVVSDAY